MFDGYYYTDEEAEEEYEQAMITNYMLDNNIKPATAKQPEVESDLPF